MIIVLTLILFTIGILCAAATSDFLKLRIPNLFPAVILGAFVIAYGISHSLDLQLFQNVKSHLVAGGSVFFVMVILFFMGLFGGGDAKLIPAVALWVGVKGLPVFLMVTTIAGGLLAVLSITLRKTTVGQKLVTKLLKHQKLQDGWVGALAKGENVVPYGIAIACGGIGAFRTIGLLP